MTGSRVAVSSADFTPEAATLTDAAEAAQAPSAPSGASGRVEKEEKGLSAVDSEAKGRGVLYVAQLPHGWTRLQVIRYFERFGEVTRVFLNRKEERGGFRKGKRFVFTDGWIEYRKKRHAKRVVALLDGQPVGGKKRNKHAQDLLMLSYLKKFNFSSLYEDAMHIKRTRQDRLNAQMARVKKESQMYVELLEHKHSAEQLKQRISRKNKKVQEQQPNDNEEEGGADAVSLFPFDAATKRRNDAAKRKCKNDAGSSGLPNKKKINEASGSASVSRSLLKRLAA
ncbi:hypothetical protein ACSSS7_007877 [Eimeria intestinalis]